MINAIPVYLYCLAALLASALVSMYSVRKILFITRSRKIYDIPDDIRKIHGAEIPSLGGIGIFIGYILVAAFFWPVRYLPLHFMLPATALLFFTGIYDDLMNMSPWKKLVTQLAASAIIVYLGEMRIESLYGIFGVGELSYWVSICLTILCCTFFINAFNFIDGIDGLACAFAILYTGIFGVLFAILHDDGLAWVSFSIAGATLGLLFFNVAPAKIYMGDTGSMLLGFTIFILSVLFVKVYGNEGQGIALIHGQRGALLIALAMLFVPVYDAVRVFILRASRGVSPLKADRTHLHYYLLDAGFTHSRSVLIILAINVLIIAATCLLQGLDPLIVLLSMALIMSVAVLVIYKLRQRHLSKVVSLAQKGALPYLPEKSGLD